jgi:hypothetical protein
MEIPAATVVAGPVTLCAWCARYGRPHAAAREHVAGEWRAIPHEHARNLYRASGTSHGICSWCLPVLAAEWEIPLPLPRSGRVIPPAMPLAI